MTSPLFSAFADAVSASGKVFARSALNASWSNYFYFLVLIVFIIISGLVNLSVHFTSE